MKRLPIKPGVETVVDDDYVLSPNHTLYVWQTDGHRYAAVRIAKSRERKFLHHIICPPPSGSLIDHINGDTLDNRSSNLRACTPSQNQMNRRPNAGRDTKGLHYDATHGKWRVRVAVNRKYVHGGYFVVKEDAIRRANELMVELHGPFARLNTLPTPRPLPGLNKNL